MPGKQTGVMQRSIRSKVSRSGYSVSVYPTKTSQMGEVYYPAFVVYGHRGPNSETAREARQHRKRSGVKVAEPRANFIPVAAQRYQQTFQTVITAALDKAIK
ncbi:hypothetical protein [Sutterella sp.]|uniref:hypothetical protein n=1 Tax=Sutterella sp. TaxID=1981025 RepID=UPI0026E10A23|nr:hypothetical protein [Sutterella sp.]MDO5531421.1 hypothetical protein [Sutterella sp.]